MTDAEKIEKLARWMGKDTPEGHDPRIMQGADGRYYVDTIVCAHSKNAEPGYRVKIWSPGTDLNHAWMLAEKMYEKAGMQGFDFAAWWNENSFGLCKMTASEAAALISNTVLEIIQ